MQTGSANLLLMVSMAWLPHGGCAATQPSAAKHLSSEWETIGSGLTAEAARDAAMGKMAVQIAAHVQAACSSRSRHIESAAGHDAFEAITCETVVRSTSSQRGPQSRWTEFLLHRQLEPSSDGSRQFWRVTLDRKRMAKVLSAEASELAAQFVVLSTETLAQSSDRRAFAAGWSKLMSELKPELDHHLTSLLMLDRPERKLRGRVNKSIAALRKAAGRLRKAHPILIAWIEPTIGDLPRRTDQAALSLGLQTQATASLCVKLKSQTLCEDNAFAMATCRVVIAGDLKICGGSKATEFAWHPPADLAGVDRQSRSRATTMARANLSAEVLQGFWRHVLQSELPL